MGDRLGERITGLQQCWGGDGPGVLTGVESTQRLARCDSQHLHRVAPGGTKLFRRGTQRNAHVDTTDTPQVVDVANHRRDRHRDARRMFQYVREIGVLGMQNQSITGVFLGAEMASERAQTMIGGLVDDVAAGRLKVLVDRKFPLSEAPEAHAFIESRQAIGRVVLIP